VVKSEGANTFNGRIGFDELKLTESCGLSDWLYGKMHSLFLYTFFKISQYAVPHTGGQERILS